MDACITNKLLVIKPAYDAWPVGFAYVLACLEANGVLFDFLDVSRLQNWKNELEYKLGHGDYFAVATGGLIGFYRFFMDVAAVAGKTRPDIPVILGGNVTRDASENLLFERIGATYGVLGEAETALPGLIRALQDRPPELGNLPGLVYKDAQGLVRRNPPQRHDLQRQNIMPAWHYFDMDYYFQRASIPLVGKNPRYMPVLTGRGCVGRCSFCSPTIGGFRKRPIEHVLEEIDKISSQYEFDHIAFYNEMFYPTCEEIQEFCRQYLRLPRRKSWMAGVRVDAQLDVDTLAIMKDAGCFSVSVGIESGSDRILKLMNKKTTAAQIRTFFRNARKAGLPANGTFMIGNEGETEEDIKKTIDLVIEEEINTGESLLYVYPGTLVYKHAVEKGLIKDELAHLEKATQNYTCLFVPYVKSFFLNVSAIPDDRFFPVATREVRRYLTFLFNRYAVRDLKGTRHYSHGDTIMGLQGRCRECGQSVNTEYEVFSGWNYKGILGPGVNDRLICPSCYTPVSFNLAQAQDGLGGMARHLANLRDRIARKNRILICGLNQDSLFLMRIDLLNMDYEKIKGMMDTIGWCKGDRYIHFPLVSVAEAAELEPDAILMTDAVSGFELKLEKEFHRHGKRMPEFLYLCDAALRRTLKTLRFKELARNKMSAMKQWMKQFLVR